MKWLSIFAAITVLMVLKKFFPQTLRRLQLPMNIVVSVLSLFLVVCTVIGSCQVVNSDMDITGKLLFVLFAIAYVSVFVWSNYRFWKEWFRKDKSD